MSIFDLSLSFFPVFFLLLFLLLLLLLLLLLSLLLKKRFVEEAMAHFGVD